MPPLDPHINDAPPDRLIPSTSSDDSSVIPDGSNMMPGDAHELSNTTQGPESAIPKPRKSRISRFFVGYWQHKLWTFPLTLMIVAAAVFAIPAARYPVLAYAGLRRQFTVSVIDSKTNTPVSGASVLLDGATATTSNTGKATFHTKVGIRMLSVRMKYYQNNDQHVFVGISSLRNSLAVRLNATGRQVPIIVMNKITDKAIANADVKILDTDAKTDQRGMATIVLPTTASTQPATITATGYNQATASITVTAAAVASNTITLTPAGSVYFLSNLSGTIDVVSANLDGTNRTTIFAGTGNEDVNNTVLTATHDWKYLALLSKRDGGQHAKLYVVNTSTNQATQMDTDTADFTPIGWSGHYFVYEAALASANAWESGGTILRSYDADTGKITSIDTTTAMGTDTTYIYSYFGFVDLVGSRVVYGFGWNDFNSNYVPNNLGGQKIMLMSANLDGSNKQDIRDISISNGVTYAYDTAVSYTPQVLYIQTALGSQSSVYYTYQDQNNSITQSSTITAESFAQVQQNNTSYLVSPSGAATFWDQQRDGQNTLFIGDSNGANGTQIATQSAYAPYAWFTDDYVLVQQNENQLYIMPAGGGTATKISDYYHPKNTTPGIGGYGSQ